MEGQCMSCTLQFAQEWMKLLSCGHCYCVNCLPALIQAKNRLMCPIDSQITSFEEKGSEVKGVFCPRHRDKVGNEICVSHLKVFCEECGHGKTEDCQVRDLERDYDQVFGLVVHELERLVVLIPSTRLSASLQQNLEARLTQPLSQNVELLEMLRYLYDTLKSVLCCRCYSPSVVLFDTQSFDAYCDRCPRDGVDLTSTVDISMVPEEDLVELLANEVPGLVKRVNFCSLDVELLKGMKNCKGGRPGEVQTLGKRIIGLKSNQKCDFEGLPDRFYCPKCIKAITKAECDMRIIPCMKLHAICEDCARLVREKQFVTCPLDGLSYGKKVEELQRLRAPSVGQGMGGLPMQGPASRMPMPAAAPFRTDLVLPPQAKQPSEPYAYMRAVPVEQPIAQPDSTASSSPIPDLPLPPGTYSLTRFNSVQPPLHSNPANCGRDCRGWSVALTKHQVEVVTFACLEHCSLIGIGLANPVDEGKIILVESVSVYLGEMAVGEPVGMHNGQEPLAGGDNVITHIYFTRPFHISPFTAMTLKIVWKSLLDDSADTLILYRGNPFTRPELYMGSDNLMWEFYDVKDVELSEYVNGQNYLSGPILRLIYSRE